MTAERSAEVILSAARKFMRNRRRATWKDYNRFKLRLINAGCYGYEQQLADILKL